MTRSTQAGKVGIRRASLIAIAALASGAAALLSVGGALGATVTSATLTGAAGTLTSGGTLYAKQNGALKLVVATDADTKCVTITGAHTATQSSNSAGTTSWTFNFTAPAGNGAQTLTATAWRSKECSGGGASDSEQASYVLDNAGPAVTATTTPAPNDAKWNRQNVSITWSASDGTGSGVASGPTPATDGHNVDTTVDGVTKTATATDRLGNTATGATVVKLDKQAPSIVAGRSPAANAYGWNRAAVVVGYECSDAISGIKSCPAAETVSADGAGQLRSGTAIDNADNANTATIGSINIDKVAPTLSGAPATAPDGDNGWYRGSVAIDWTCADGLSGIAGSCPTASTIAGEGENLTASAAVTDKAGNATSATSAPAVKIDRTPPTTTAAAAGGAWNNTDVTVTLDGDDALSGPARTYFEVDGGAAQLYDADNKPSFSEDGVYALEFWTIDNAGNAEPHNAIEVKIDKTDPTIAHTLSPEANLAGWNDASTTVHFLCADPGGSGIETCSADVAVTTEGINPITGTALDKAGNDVSESFDVRVDKTAPSIAAATDRAPNAAGWYSADVTVSFTCADVKPAGVDTISGLASCAAAQTLGEGENQSASGTAVDTAGNSASDAAANIDIDKTAPSLAGEATTAPNGAGWYRADVVVAWACADALSGIDGGCPANSTIGGEGDDLSAARSVSDIAGNTTTATAGPMKIDRTAPSTSAAVPEPLGTGWYAGDVEVKLTGVDALSGIGTTLYSVDGGSPQTYDGPFQHLTKGIHTIRFWSVDNAGNVENKDAPGHTITLKIDGVAPSITGSRAPEANAFGWVNSDVTVSFECSDAESGVESCEAPIALSNEGADQSATGNARDTAGNEAQTTVAGINIDKTPPTLSGAATTSANAAGWYRGDVKIHWTAEDGLSGIDPATEPADSTIGGEGSNLGAGPVSVFDKAGNTASASMSAVKIDRTAPVITSAATTSPNADGWYRTDVTVAFSCTDPKLQDGSAGSGVASCPSDKVLQGDGANQSVTSDPAADLAGNTAAGKTHGAINIDGHEPQTSAAIQCTSKNGYCRGATATVVLTATDAGPSGVKEIHYKINGVEQTASGASKSVNVALNNSGTATVFYWAVDKAGNVEPAGASELKWDRIAPTVTHVLNPTANAADWSKADTTVHFDATDDFSGVDASTVTPDVVVDEETAARVVQGSADDNAGNTGTDSVTVKLDKTAPTISGAPTTSPNASGWYTGAVKVHFTCADALSGIAVCPDDITITTNGSDQSVEGKAIDHAGNAKTITVGGIGIDSTKPTIDVRGVTAGEIYTLGDVPKATCEATDAGSGPGGCTVSISGGLASGVGTFTYTATGGDVAGNTATATGTYRVIYRWDGMAQPINDTAHQTGVDTSVFKAGSTVPAKLALRKADGTVVQAGSLPAWLTPAKGGPTTAAVDENVYSDPATSGATYRWDATAQQYIYNWGTAKANVGYYWRVGVRLEDGQTYTVNVGLR